MFLEISTIFRKELKMKTIRLPEQVILFTLFLMLVNVTAGKTIYVDIERPGGDGERWDTAYKYLQDALASAIEGDEIWVAEGSYRPDQDAAHPLGTNDRNATFHLKDGLMVYGGFLGTETHRDERDWEDNATILTGDVGTVGYDEDNCYTVVYTMNAKFEPLLDGFTITGGCANGSVSAQGAGGGMYNSGGSPGPGPCVRNCTFISNFSLGYGGGMYNYECDPTVANCTFEENESKDPGGGMCNMVANPRVTDCVFRKNKASWGGGVCNSYRGSDPIFNNCEFFENTAIFGGGMSNRLGSNPEVTGCKFNYGEAEREGGGMSNYHNSSPTVTNCRFHINKAGEWGGGMANFDECAPTVTDCTFYNNTSVEDGGGMCNIASDPRVTNDCMFDNNIAHRQGGGMFNAGGSPYVEGCEFHSNKAYGAYGDAGPEQGGGGGMFNHEGMPAVVNCIFRLNSAEDLYGDGGGYGGGMMNRHCSPVIVDCSFTSNSAVHNGGGMSNYDRSSPDITSCIFDDNEAGSCGGGMAARYSSSPTLINCLFIQNSATYNNIHYGGGGFSCDFYCEPSIINCTFIGNEAAGTGGALHGSNYGMSVINCILWGNSAAGGGDEIALWNGCPLSINYCDVQGGSEAVYSGDGTPVTWGDGMIDVDPLFKDAEGRLSWSPCINAGNNTACDVMTDLDGNPRIVNGVIDMGAYEYQRAFPDDDGDGIENSIDTLPDIPSSDFADAAGTTGSIGPHGGWGGLLITDETDPAGVRITAHPTEPTWAEVTVCGGTVLEFTMGDEAVITCGSVEIEVISGPVEITFTAIDGTVATTSLEAGDSLIAEPETLTITAPLTNSNDVIIMLNGQPYTLIPGQTLDITPPTIDEVYAHPDVLWPVNHKMVEVAVEVDVDDNCDPEPYCYILGVFSNEPINGPGDGNTDPDWEYTDNPLVVLLRAESAGDGDGRTYTIHVECKDVSGNTAIAEVEVIVPHDQGGGKKK
jgi:hypothetical protein